MLIIVSPFITYLHLLFNKYATQIDLFGFSYEHYFKNNQAFAWFVLSQLVSMFLLINMFLSTSRKWKYSLIIILIFHFLNFVYRLDIFDNSSGSFALPVAICTIGFIGILLLFDLIFFKRLRNEILLIKLNLLLKWPSHKISGRMIKNVRRHEKNDTSEEQRSVLKNLFNHKISIEKWIETYNVKTIPNVVYTNKISPIVWLGIVLITSSLWFIHNLFPEGLDQISFGVFVLDSNGFNDVNTFIWYIARKSIISILLIVWFLNCPYWWRYAILSPLFINIYQFWESFQDIASLEAFGNLRVFPMVFISMLVVFLLSRIVKNQLIVLDYRDTIDLEIEKLLREPDFAYSKAKEYRKKYRQIIEGGVMNDGSYSTVDKLHLLKSELQRFIKKPY